MSFSARVPAICPRQNGLHKITQLVGRELIALDIGYQFSSSINDGGVQRVVH
jgi:hypothetical protein